MEVAESSVGEFVDDKARIGVARVFVPSGVSAVFVVGKHFSCFEPENNNVVVADSLANFDVRAVERAQSNRAVHHEFHIARAGSLFGRGGNLFGNVGGRIDNLADRDAEIFNEEDFQAVVD